MTHERFQNFVLNASAPAVDDVIEIFSSQSLPKPGVVIELVKEISPADLYCYLQARFGPPNGVLTLVKNDDSDNLIHWDWMLAAEDSCMMIQGHNFRTEIHLCGKAAEEKITSDCVAEIIKADFQNHGREMTSVRAQLEKWTEFINPYDRIRSSVESLKSSLCDIRLKLDRDLKLDPTEKDFSSDDLTKALQMHSNAIGLCFGIRSMLPVMAEAFINLILFICMKPEFKNDQRVYDSIFREHIDIRVRKLHVHCMGFRQGVSPDSEPYKRYLRVVNERNDLLHGNVNVEKLKFNEVYFDGKTPIFREYKSFHHRSVGAWAAVSGFDLVDDECMVVDQFIDCVLGSMDPSYSAKMRRLLSIRDLGYRSDTKMVGVLFPNHLVEFRADPSNVDVE